MRLPANGTLRRWMSPKFTEVGATQTSPVGTDGSKRSVVRSSDRGVAAAHACGEHDAG